MNVDSQDVKKPSTDAKQIEDHAAQNEGLFFRSQKGLFEIQITLDGPLIGLFILALATRFYRLEYPRSVV